MLSRGYRLAIFLLNASLLVLVPNAQAGDVVDFLPEVQLAESLVFAADNAFVTDEDCAGFDISVEIPENLLFDINGQRRTAAESGQILFNLNCLYFLIQTSEDINSSSNIARFLDVFQGQSVTFENGIVIDGGKQSVRVSLIFGFLISIAFERSGFVDLGIFDGDPCDQLRDWAINAPTLELQWLAFIVLAGEAVTEDMAPRECTTEVSGTRSELIALTEQGDLDAAIALVADWQLELETEFGEEPTADQLEGIQAKVSEFELFILANTMRFPLLTLAASVPLSGLVGFEAELQ